MKILQIATSAGGGAGIAAVRLNSALNSLGLHSVLLSGSSSTLPRNKNEVIAKKKIVIRNLSKVITVLQSRLVQKRAFLMTPYSIDTISVEEILKHNPEIIHIHTFYNLLSAKTISKICNLGIPVFISLHDERFYTGGCHHALFCSKFKSKCSNCPETPTLFHEVILRAQDELTKAFGQDETPIVIAPSHWILLRAKASKVLEKAEIFKINNPLSPEFIEKSERHRKNRVEPRPFLITFVAQDLYSPYKGLESLVDCINLYEDEFVRHNIKFVFVGKGPEVEIGALKWRQYKKVNSSKLIDIYFESDLLIVPSLVDNSPNVIFEALVCGTPFVGSDQAGIPELSKAFGMEFFKYGDPESMIKAILRQKETTPNPWKIRKAALELVHPEVVAKKMSELYLSKLTNSN
jgi:glycosyltransferase involved in cell wall biosynthesis